MKIAVLILLSVMSAFSLDAQTMQQAQQQIKTYLDGIYYWRFQYNAEDTSFGREVNKEDSVNNINTSLSNYIKNTVVKVPGILKRALKLPENADMRIVSSADKKVNIYTWNTHKEGEQFAAIALYEHRGMKTYEMNAMNNKPGEYVDIIEVSGSNKKYYLPVMKITLPDKAVMKSVWAYSITDGIMQQEELFAREGKATSNIGYAYDYTSNYDFTKMKETYTVYTGKNGKKLYLPLAEQNNMLNGRWDVYTFDGSKFIYEGVE